MRCCSRALGLFALLLAGAVHAGETDQFYAWHALPADSTRVFDAYFNDGFSDALANINARPWRGMMSCIEVASEMTMPMYYIEYKVEFGAPRGFEVRMSPASNEEYVSRYRELSLYRDAPFWMVFLDWKVRPTVLVHDTFVGLDKISHMRDEGLRYYPIFHRALESGSSEEEAFDAVMRIGVEQEEGIFGRFFTGIFSFADLEANAQGLRLFRDLCDGDAPQLVFHEPVGWTLREPIDFSRYITPCFDESWQLNSLPEAHKVWMRPALKEFCRMRGRPELAARHWRYRQRGCSADVSASLARLEAKGVAPPRAGTMLDEVCASMR